MITEGENMTTESKNLFERLRDAYNECVNIGDGSSAVAINDSIKRLETMVGNLDRAHMSTAKKLSEISALRGYCDDLEEGLRLIGRRHCTCSNKSNHAGDCAARTVADILDEEAMELNLISIKDIERLKERLGGTVSDENYTVILSLKLANQVLDESDELAAEVETLRRSRDGWEADAKRGLRNVADRDTLVAELMAEVTRLKVVSHNEFAGAVDSSKRVTELETEVARLNASRLHIWKEKSELRAELKAAGHAKAKNTKYIGELKEELYEARERLEKVEAVAIGMFWTGTFGDTTIAKVKELGLNARERIAALEKGRDQILHDQINQPDYTEV